MAHGDFKDLPRWTIAINIAKNLKHDWYQYRVASTVYKFFDKKALTAHKETGINYDVVSENTELAKNLHKPQTNY